MLQGVDRDSGGPFFPAGDVTRLHRKLQSAPSPSALNLAHGLWGREQMAVVQVRHHTRADSTLQARCPHGSTVRERIVCHESL